jgi:hypothetical protein
VTSRPGPRSFRTQPHPVEELTIADRPLATAVAEQEPEVEETTQRLPEPAATASQPEPDEPTSRIAALDGPEPEDVDQGFASGVTPSADWGDDDDCWSAPV